MYPSHLVLIDPLKNIALKRQQYVGEFIGCYIIPQQSFIPPPRDDWDRLFQPMFDEDFTPPSVAVSPVQEAAALRVVVLSDSLVSTSID
ncbi:hypothetical protein Tco_0818067 [Tanacetum coccineum]